MKLTYRMLLLLVSVTLAACSGQNVVPDERLDQGKESPTVLTDEEAFKQASWNWTSEAGGVSHGYAQFSLFGQTQSISIVKYPECGFKTEIVYNAGDDCVTADAAAKASNAALAINGSYFNTTKLVSATTLCLDGKLISTASSSEAKDRSTGVVCFDDAGKVSIMKYNSSSVSVWRQQYKSVMSSGPLLVLNGVEETFTSRDFNTARHPRSMIGVTSDRTVVLVVVDGRFNGKAAGATIPEMAKIAGYLGLKNALNLDGGGSSTLWTKGAGVLNYPCDNSTWDHSGCRRVPTVIIAK